MSEPQSPPPCPACGIAMMPSRRTMRVHNIRSGRAIPEDKTVDVWRCPACGREQPRG
jgi:predicted RNA-binding Zn-ribbon protein involved in translation (DUF1610 family)